MPSYARRSRLYAARFETILWLVHQLQVVDPTSGTYRRTIDYIVRLVDDESRVPPAALGHPSFAYPRPCGTEVAYRDHVAAGESCPACTDAHRRRVASQRKRPSRGGR